MVRKHLIHFDTCKVDKDKYLITFWQDLSAYNQLEKLEQTEKFVKKTLKYRESIGNQVILDILSDFSVDINKMDTNDIVSALKCLNAKNKEIKIVPLKAPKNTKVLEKTKYGHEVYIDEEDNIGIGELIVICQVARK